jgi:hypothetical protein
LSHIKIGIVLITLDRKMSCAFIDGSVESPWKVLISCTRISRVYFLCLHMTWCWKHHFIFYWKHMVVSRASVVRQIYYWKGLLFSARQDLEGFSRVCILEGFSRVFIMQLLYSPSIYIFLFIIVMYANVIVKRFYLKS